MWISLPSQSKAHATKCASVRVPPQVRELRVFLANQLRGGQQDARRIPGAFQERFAGAIGQADAHRLVSRADLQLLEVDLELEVRVRFAQGHELLRSGGVDHGAGDAERLAVAVEDLGERLADDDEDASAPAGDGLRRVLAARPAAEVLVHEEHRGLVELRLVERVRLAVLLQAGPVVLEGVLTETVEGHGLEKAGGNDAVGIDVVAAYRDGATFDDDSLTWVGHVGGSFPLPQMPKTSRASATSPLIAAAATMAGLIRSVRPVDEPWRPLKLRLLLEALSCVPTS